MTSAPLDRRLGTVDAVVLGLSSMIGAGVFAVFAPAARVAGPLLLIGLVLAAVLAFANAVASAQLAAAMPVSGGTYAYGRERLGPWWGFVAGWGFVIGKTASCAAMAETFAAYLLPGSPWGQRLLGVAAVAALAVLNTRGVTRTALLSRILVTITLVALAAVVAVALASGPGRGVPESGGAAGGPYGVLQSAGLVFFAFAGYARIATMGEEVRDPARTIPRAIPLALGIAVVVYLAVGLAALSVLGPVALGGAQAPLDAVVLAAGAPALSPVVRIGAAVASLGALLALLAGVGRTMLAMARNRDLPAPLAVVHPIHRVPQRAEVVLAVAVSVLVLTVDLRGAIGFSSFGVLVYYSIANAAAFRQPDRERRWPRWVNVLGAAGCVLLAATLPLPAVLTGAAVLGLGAAGRGVALRLRARTGGRA